jgi:hypothetical protein
MHLACIGVMKRILNRLKSSKKAEVKCHLSCSYQEILNERIVAFSHCVPSEFSRKMSGGLNSVAFWKATELRLFLLYAGIVVLEGITAQPFYRHFIKLCVAMRILLSNNQLENTKIAQQLLKQFVESSIKLYGLSFISYNVHCLLHLADDYVKWGPLDNVSCFSLENYLGTCVKGCLSGKNKPFEQLCCHLSIQNRKPSQTLCNIKTFSKIKL